MRIITLVRDKLKLEASVYNPSARAYRIFRHYDMVLAQGRMDAVTATERCIHDLAGRSGGERNAPERQPQL